MADASSTSAGYDRRVFRIDGIDGESIVVDGNWVEKLRTNTSRGATRRIDMPGRRSRSSATQEVVRRQKEQLLQVIVNVGTFYSCSAGRAAPKSMRSSLSSSSTAQRPSRQSRDGSRPACRSDRVAVYVQLLGPRVRALRRHVNQLAVQLVVDGVDAIDRLAQVSTVDIVGVSKWVIARALPAHKFVAQPL